MDGIIFDIDGTLWNPTDEVAKSWNQAIRECTKLSRTITGAQLRREFGKPLDVIINALFPELSPTEQTQLSVHLFDYENRWLETAPCPIYEHVPDTLEALSKRYPLFIVSNCQSGYIESFLKNTGFSKYITDYTCHGDTGLQKQDTIRLIMDRNHLASAVHVGDTQGDADACQKADVPMIYVSYGFGTVKEPFLTIHRFDELLEIDFDSHIAKPIP